MKAVVTRVMSAKVEIDKKIQAQIGKGLLVLLGVQDLDTEEDAGIMAKKISSLRIFEDENGKMNKSCKEIDGEIIIVSNFTLYGDCKKGNRPSFVHAARPETANPLYEYVADLCRDSGYNVQTGVFGADMKVFSINNGPVTIIIDTELMR